MCITGGKRCEYPDAISNVRKKARYHHRNSNDRQRNDAVEKAVLAFQNENPDFTKAHLPNSETFQVKAPKWEVPARLIEMLGNSRHKIKGAEFDDRKAFYAGLTAQNTQWMNSLTANEKAALSKYTTHHYEEVNLYLRGKGYRQWFKDNRKDRFPDYAWDPNAVKHTPENVYENRLKPVIDNMTLAMDKASRNDEPRKLYRYHRIPGGITSKEYADKYFKDGEGFKDKGFMSTTADPEFVAAHILNAEKDKTGDRYVVFEILTKDGGSLQIEEDPYQGRMQGGIHPLEAEVVLPRNKGMRIIDHGTRTFEFAKNRIDMQKHWRPKDDRFRKGRKVSVELIRMIDEDLIREVRKQL